MVAFRAWVIGVLLSLALCHPSWTQIRDSISISFQDLPLEIILDSIAEKSGYDFSYNSQIIPPGSLYTYTSDKIKVDDLLNILFIGINLQYVKLDDQYVIKRAKLTQLSDGSTTETPKIVIAGWVRESDTKKPIVGANVYLQGSTIGTTTDQNGNYRLPKMEPGSYIIVFSHIGYQTGSYTFKGGNDLVFSVNALLENRVETLQGIEVVSDRLIDKAAERSRHFGTFKRELLGTSANALYCEILNPEVLDYSYNEPKDFLQVIAHEPIIVKNFALGYQIILDLDYFNKIGSTINFHGQARYEAMEPESRKIKNRWKRNRMEAYNGSMIHFFQSLVSNNLEADGYRIGLAETIERTEGQKLMEVSRHELITRVEGSKEWKLAFENYLFVEYVKETVSNTYLQDVQVDAKLYPDAAVLRERKGISPGTQKSLITLKNESILIGRDGTIDDRLSIVSYGYWSWERLGDLMPINYNPKKDNL